MRRGVNGMDAMETINAAASVIASAETRDAHGSVQKRRWGSCWSLYQCFGLSKNNKRIGHAVLITEPASPTARPDPPISDHPPSHHPLSITVPFVAPPSSPASFLPSEPPSATQSPTGLLPSMTSLSSNMMCSPSGPTSIFVIGPYAHETQLVSPPVFSTFTTEPSTAPYTPPPESVHLTTPSSPEVPFARLLEPNAQNVSQRYPFAQCEFQSYQLQPGSPVSHLISPSSGTSSPFPDREFAAAAACPFFLEFRTGNPPKLLDLKKIVWRDRGSSCHDSGTVTPDAVGPKLDCENSDMGPLLDTDAGEPASSKPLANHRVSFEMKGDEFGRCLENNPVAYPKLEEKRKKPENEAELEETPGKSCAGDGSNGEQKQQTNCRVSLGLTKEFNFDSVGGRICEKPGVGSSDWWVNEKAAVDDGTPDNHWLFFATGLFSQSASSY